MSTPSLAGANAYFAADNHLQSGLWTGATPDARKAALATARRQIARALGSVYVDESDVAAADQQSYAYACYEQALHVILSTGLGNAEGTVPAYPAAGPDPEDKTAARKPTAEVIGREARLWLGMDSQSVIVTNG